MSRDEIIKYLYDNHARADVSIEDIADTLSPQTGHWEENQNITIGQYGECSECGYKDERWYMHRYCPWCGSHNKDTH